MSHLSLFYDSTNKFEDLIADSEKIFGVNFHWVSSINANAINYIDEYVIDFTPNKIEIMFSNTYRKEKYDILMDKILGFIITQFKNQTVVVKSHNKYLDKPKFKNIKQVKIIVS